MRRTSSPSPFSPAASTIPTLAQAALGRSFVWNGTQFTVVSRTLAHYAGVEGELPFEYWDKTEVTFVDLRSEGADFATLDYSDEAPALYIGKAVDFDDVAAEERPHLRRLVEMADGTGRRPRQRALRQLSQLRGSDGRPHVRPRRQRRLPELPLDSRRRPIPASPSCRSTPRPFASRAAHSAGHPGQAARHRPCRSRRASRSARSSSTMSRTNGASTCCSTRIANSATSRSTRDTGMSCRRSTRCRTATRRRTARRRGRMAGTGLPALPDRRRDDDVRARRISVADSRRRHDDRQRLRRAAAHAVGGGGRRQGSHLVAGPVCRRQPRSGRACRCRASRRRRWASSRISRRRIAASPAECGETRRCSSRSPRCSGSPTWSARAASRRSRRTSCSTRRTAPGRLARHAGLRARWPAVRRRDRDGHAISTTSGWSSATR